MDNNFVPPLEIPLHNEILENLKIFIVHMVVGNRANSEVILAAYPRYMHEFLIPSSSFVIDQLSRYVIGGECSLPNLQLYLEKMSNSSTSAEKGNSFAFSPNWYILLSSLNSTIEIPILLWNIGTLEFLYKGLAMCEECLDFARQLRSVLFHLV